MNTSNELWMKCPCFHCGGSIEFDAQKLPPVHWMLSSIPAIISRAPPSTLEVICPHCGESTWLYANSTGKLKAQSQAAAYTPHVLQECSICHGKVAPTASHCPHCGAKRYKPPIMQEDGLGGCMAGCGCLVIAAIGLALLILLLGLIF
jgi:hypothetical protein